MAFIVSPVLILFCVQVSDDSICRASMVQNFLKIHEPFSLYVTVLPHISNIFRLKMCRWLQ